MSFGISITGNNSQLILDGSSGASTEFFTPSAVQTVSVTFSYNKLNTFLFMQLQNPTGTQLLGGNNLASPTSITFNQTTRIFTMQKTTQLPTTSFSSETYGLELTNSNGDITFSTRALQSVGLNIIKVYDSLSLGHGDIVHSGTDLSNIFVTAPANMFTGAGTIAAFTFSGTQITFTSDFNFSFSGGGGQNVRLPNDGSVAVAELKV